MKVACGKSEFSSFLQQKRKLEALELWSLEVASISALSKVGHWAGDPTGALLPTLFPTLWVRACPSQQGQGRAGSEQGSC